MLTEIRGGFSVIPQRVSNFCSNNRVALLVTGVALTALALAAMFLRSTHKDPPAGDAGLYGGRTRDGAPAAAKRPDLGTGGPAEGVGASSAAGVRASPPASPPVGVGAPSAAGVRASPPASSAAGVGAPSAAGVRASPPASPPAGVGASSAASTLEDIENALNNKSIDDPELPDVLRELVRKLESKMRNRVFYYIGTGARNESVRIWKGELLFKANPALLTEEILNSVWREME